MQEVLVHHDQLTEFLHHHIQPSPLRSQCTLSLPPECFQRVEKGCIGNQWVNAMHCGPTMI